MIGNPGSKGKYRVCPADWATCEDWPTEGGRLSNMVAEEDYLVRPEPTREGDTETVQFIYPVPRDEFLKHYAKGPGPLDAPTAGGGLAILFANH